MLGIKKRQLHKGYKKKENNGKGAQPKGDTTLV